MRERIVRTKVSLAGSSGGRSEPFYGVLAAGQLWVQRFNGYVKSAYQAT